MFLTGKAFAVIEQSGERLAGAIIFPRIDAAS